MVGEAKMTVSETSIDKVVPTRDDSKLEHAFTLKAKLKVSKRTMGALSSEGIESLELEWNETIDWFEYHADGTWQHKRPEEKDMYAEKPSSNTFKTWQEMRYFLASDPSNESPATLTAAVEKFNSTADRDKTAKHWIAENGFEWTIPVATDRPVVGLKSVAGSGGGGGESLVTSNSRRRVSYFDLGFKGSSTRVSATQILESVNNKPKIHKFIVPGIEKAEADDPKKLTAWRTELRNPRPSRHSFLNGCLFAEMDRYTSIATKFTNFAPNIGESELLYVLVFKGTDS